MDVIIWQKDHQQKPLSSFLSSILNFNSLIPATPEVNTDNTKKKKTAQVSTLGKCMTFALSVFNRP